jgi:uncharacterized membrane protein YeaQ/YmgE (transglycosylase-associated protein family)
MIFASAVQLYWFISTGLLIGLSARLIIKNEGVSLWTNLIWGIIGAVISGTVGINFSIGDGVLFAFIGTPAFLFLINVFHQHHVEDLMGEDPANARIKPRNPDSHHEYK